MSLKTAIPFIGAAIAVGVLAAVTGGVSVGPTLLFAASIGYGAGLFLDSVIFKPKMVTSATQMPQIQFSTANEGAPVPVIFGTTRLPGNFTNFDPSKTVTTAITQTTKSGGKGHGGGSSSQTQTVGYIYSCPFEVGLCMGPIDGVGEIYTSPNAKKVRDLSSAVLGGGIISSTSGTNIVTGSGTSFMQLKPNDVLTTVSGDFFCTIQSIQSDYQVTTFETTDSTITNETYNISNVIIPITGFGGADYINLTLAGVNNEGGTLRVYQGNATQTRIGSGDPWGGDPSNSLNNRNVCFGVFTQGYQLGQEPVAKTYQIELQRMPKPVDQHGAAIPNFYTRGSYDGKHICFQDANPAAVIYEIMTNKIWGMRRDPATFDLASFAQASQSLALNNIGMSFALDSSQNLSAIIDTVKAHCSLSVYNTGTTVKCRWLYDNIGDSYSIKAKLTKSQLKNFKHSRIAWGQQTNEIRAQFVNRLAAYTNQVAHVQDLASIQATGYIISSEINLIGFSNPDISQRMLTRVLRDASYPQATMSFEMNRWDEKLEQFDLVELDWDEFTDDNVKTYIRIVSAEFMEDETGSISVTAMEDPVYVPTEETSPTLPQPVFAFQQIVPPGQAEISTVPSAVAAPNIAPVAGIELNCFASPLVPAAVFAAEKNEPYLASIDIQWSPLAANNFTDLGKYSCFAVTGKLTADYPVTKTFDRRTGMAGTITVLSDLANILGANLVQHDGDSFENLVSVNKCFVLVDQEIMQVGFAQSTGGNGVTLTNIARGCFSTAIQAHATGASFFYLPTLDTTNDIVDLNNMDDIALNGTPAVEFSAAGLANGLAPLVAIQVFINADQGVHYLANRPFAPGQYNKPTVTSGTPGSTAFLVNFKLRPRAITQGAGVDSFSIAMSRTGTPVDPYTEFRVQQFDSTGTQIGTAYDNLGPLATIIDSVADDATTGLVAIVGYTCQANAKTLKVFAVVNGWQSMVPTVISLGV